MNPLFEVHKLNDVGMGKAQQIAGFFDGLCASVENIVAEPKGSRELSIFKTKLEEACFFAKKAMANKAENQA